MVCRRVMSVPGTSNDGSIHDLVVVVVVVVAAAAVAAKEISFGCC